MSVQVPTIGRIVIHRTQDPMRQHNGSKEHPAVVTRAWGENCVNLKVLPDCGEPYDTTSSMRIDSEDGNAHGWFWPPRV